MKCINCGNEIMNGQKFCPRCGTSASKQASHAITVKMLVVLIAIMSMIIAGLFGVMIIKSI